MATNKSLRIAPLWHFMAGHGAHEKTYTELKQHFGFAAIPTNDQEANSAWQLISVLTLNLIRPFQITVGARERGGTWKRTFYFVFQPMQTLRFELIQQPRRLVRPRGPSRAPLRCFPRRTQAHPGDPTRLGSGGLTSPTPLVTLLGLRLFSDQG